MRTEWRFFAVVALLLAMLLLTGCASNAQDTHKIEPTTTAQPNKTVNQTLQKAVPNQTKDMTVSANVSKNASYELNNTPSVLPVSNVSQETPINGQNASYAPKNLTIATWNLHSFGDTKEGKPAIMDTYARILKDYDIAFVQEIRDEDGSAFVSLCAKIPTHDCKISSRAGNTSYKEQIGLIYRKGLNLTVFKDFNPDPQNRWHRPPVMVAFNVSGYYLRLYNIHIDPDVVPSELANLEQLVDLQGNVAVLGDLNAGCDYYPIGLKTNFKDWTWVIPDWEDTTVSSTYCAYDRILLNSNAKQELVGYGIRRDGISSSVSDHYLVWARLSVTNETIVESIPPVVIQPEASPSTKNSNCNSAYPTVCIPSPPPDLDCSDISYRNFKVLSPDPHRFDTDKDGIGCEK